MLLNQKNTGRATSMPTGLACGAVVSLSVTLLASAMIAKLVESGYLEETGIGYGIIVALMTASFLGALTAAGRIKRQRLMVCVISGMIHYMSLLGITGLFFGGQYEAVGVTGLLVMGGSMLAVLASGGEKRGGKRTGIKLRNR